jgi:hypothetical protein
MKSSLALGLAFAVVAALFPAQDPKEMQEAMEKMKKWTAPGKHHETLKKFLGSWATETKFFMGGQASPAEKGSTEVDWLMEGRWIRFEAKGNLMGKPVRSFTIMGYDNFKMSYVATTVGTWDTAMNRVEGDLDQHGKNLIAYGTIDEYLDGQHDKAVKLLWRFESDDKITWEIHDLAIGEKDTKVIEVVHTRKK